MFIYLIGSLAFGDAFYTASKYHQKFRQDDTEIYFKGYPAAFVGAYNLLGGALPTFNYAGSILFFSLY